MPRARSGVVHNRRVKTILSRTKGSRGKRSKLYRVAKNSMLKGLSYAFVGRKLKKRDFRKLWIARINASCRNAGISYSLFINGLKKANINLSRKILANLAASDSSSFGKLVEKAKSAVK